MFGQKRFDDKKAWITGGGSGIGRELALELARRGADVAISGRRQQRLESVAEEVRALGQKALPIVCDVTQEEAIAKTLAHIKEQWGSLDVSVANAGFAIPGRVEDQSAEDWRRQLDVNVVGAAMTAKYSLPLLRASKGRFAIVSSVAGQVCYPGGACYSSSKFAVRALGLCLAQEVKAEGVSVTIIYPGFVESEIGQVDRAGVYHEDFVDRRPQRFMWKGEKSARVMADALHRRELEFVFTKHGKVGAFLGRHAPGLVHAIMSRESMSRKDLNSPNAQKG